MFSRASRVPQARWARIGVVDAVIRRAKLDGRTTLQRLAVLRTSITDTPVRGLRFLHFRRGPGVHAVRMQQAVVGVFVVNHQQPMLGTGKCNGSQDTRSPIGKKWMRVVVHAGLLLLLDRRIRRVLLESGASRNRVTPRIEHVRLRNLRADDGSAVETSTLT